ncbi:MAG: NADH-quinone oxidoreductase subunit C [Candidatus Competibacter denitrificans]|jgi:NADH-quinone oxidoreductase subunit C|uniref:NADH-quinone oxidoreductase subunit C n=1 Tax=Candidatus Competibacter denitrificans Run_A_D11 TaxID=1400863 RepID=W6MAV9_9GAMM|nr:NADH-quinone oxidoreductase subunit C [Candidatus Competibacter denitrificans]CDI03115.1 NADH-quinone oxidoreductase subunit C [Candidatus Competibacter denitrificans Run_A_D11]HAS85384.1 NADH-quinone oxidoreductase subunit C [Candidatus Competibacteraceae bacterium]HRC68783.1 NADH-quinone oxidoreductase subunit C [Candidatus Competibacter denitrificans]
MADALQTLVEKLQTRFGDALHECRLDYGQVMIEIPPDQALAIFTALRDEPEFAFEQAMDVCGVDYAAYGEVEWATGESTNTGFSRGVEEKTIGRGAAAIRHVDGKIFAGKGRFAAVYQLLSVSRNQRLRVRVFAPDDELPVVPSVIGLWAGVNWFEREAFDLYGIVFEGHPDLRRILTDYGFVGHPFRKDFPLSGNVEMRYDPERGRVVYEPVSIEPRVLVPRVIRKDNRYLESQ